MEKLICFDMDGVIFEGSNFWLDLHKRYGTYEEGIELTKKYLKTNYPKLVEEVIGRLWKDKPEKDFMDLVNSKKYTKSAKELFAWLKENNYKTAIISSGPKQLAERAKKELDINYIYTNRVTFKDGKLVGTKALEYWPIRSGNKVEYLRKLCKDHNLFYRDCIVVGHDDADIKMARTAGFTIGFCPEDEEFKKYCNVIIEKRDLRDIIPILEKR